MKAALVTFYHIHHYGAQLQAAATVKAVEGLGASCEIVNYYVNQNNTLYRPPTSPGAVLSDAHTALHHAALKRRYKRFEEFAAAYLPKTRLYAARRELEENPPVYDVYLSGSDQIWNPKIFPDRRFDPVFFSHFTGGRKISYAPSFGVPELPEGMEGELKGYLEGFSALSVRERQGREIIAKAAGREAQVVLDPTLLLESGEWLEMAAPPQSRGAYILCYCISKPGGLSHYVSALAARTGLPVVQLCGVRRKVHPDAACVLDAGPAEFLRLFADAAYVCTNSFHGAVFSIQFGKPFFTTVSPMEQTRPERSRIYSLLTSLGLTHRVIGQRDTAGLLEPVDYQSVGERLSAQRAQCLEWLDCALRNKPLPVFAPPSFQGEGPRLAAPAACTGCTACAAACPTGAVAMKEDREGFLSPVVDLERCIRCGKCTGVCPGLRWEEPGQAKFRDDPPKVYGGWHHDEGIHQSSSSGGVFTALAQRILEQGGTVYGAVMDGDMVVRHTGCTTPEEAARLRGSKYVQSELGDCFKQVRESLKTGPVLFSGTPCQVDGLYSFLGKRPENLLTCDLVCHGAPSPGVWRDCVAALEGDHGKQLQSVNFRDKRHGWRQGHFTAVFTDGTLYSKPLTQTEFGRGDGRGLFLRAACHRCPYANLSRPADITLGDFWNLKEEELRGQQRWGVSLLLANTLKGEQALEGLPISLERFPIERAAESHPLSRTAPPAPDRSGFFAAWQLEEFPKVREGYLRMPPLYYRAAAKLLSPEMKGKIRKFLG